MADLNNFFSESSVIMAYLCRFDTKNNDAKVHNLTYYYLAICTFYNNSKMTDTLLHLHDVQPLCVTCKPYVGFIKLKNTKIQS